MESINSFKGYGKVDELQQQTFRQKSRRRCIIVTVSLIVLVVLIIGAVVGTIIHKSNNSSEPDSLPTSPLTPSLSLQAVCNVTEYPDACFSSISSLKSGSNSTDPEHIFKLSLQVAMDELSKLTDYPTKLISSGTDNRTRAALLVCEELFDDALDRLKDSMSSIDTNDGEKIPSRKKIADIKTWLSTTLTDQETCLEGLRDFNYTHIEDVEKVMKNSTVFASNSLAIVAKILGVLSEFNLKFHRKLLVKHDGDSMEYPDWFDSSDRRLLQEVNPTPTLTVAKDGTGNFTTIKEAVELVPLKSLARFVIYVKAGVYLENVVLNKSTWNVMIYGDGKTKTIVSGSLSNATGTPTFSTATFVAVGRGFIARDIGFINTAGPVKHQAVAFRSGSDFSVFQRCSFDAYQDTLYAHSNRQFYRDCDITGTVDFIFGNAAVVFQNCRIMPRQPLPNQFNTITAQGKKDPNQNTGISIHRCSLLPLDSTLTAPTYLGRPWNPYSTTIIMESSIASFLNPAGWVQWIQGVDPPSTIFYAEYQNTGPGSGLGQRVKWSGYKTNLTASDAGKFTVGAFIQGGDWLPATNVMFDLAL